MNRPIGNSNRRLHAKNTRLPIEHSTIEGEECIRIPLTKGKWATVSAHSFHKVSGFNWCFQKEYAVRNGLPGEPRWVWMHKVLAGTIVGEDTDHINGERLDNRDSNLRKATRSQNCINRPIQKNNKSGVVGVSKYDGRRWTVRININKKAKYMGLFDSLEEAIAVRKKAEADYYGAFTPRVTPSTANA